jgi:hypothetical protein
MVCLLPILAIILRLVFLFVRFFWWQLHMNLFMQVLLYPREHLYPFAAAAGKVRSSRKVWSIVVQLSSWVE